MKPDLSMSIIPEKEKDPWADTPAYIDQPRPDPFPPRPDDDPPMPNEPPDNPAQNPGG